MGGEDSGCSDDTVNVFIESAIFDPVRTAATGASSEDSIFAVCRRPSGERPRQSVKVPPRSIQNSQPAARLIPDVGAAGDGLLRAIPVERELRLWAPPSEQLGERHDPTVTN